MTGRATGSNGLATLAATETTWRLPSAAARVWTTSGGTDAWSAGGIACASASFPTAKRKSGASSGKAARVATKADASGCSDGGATSNVSVVSRLAMELYACSRMGRGKERANEAVGGGCGGRARKSFGGGTREGTAGTAVQPSHESLSTQTKYASGSGTARAKCSASRRAGLRRCGGRG